jgi:hypothetical protein
VNVSVEGLATIGLPLPTNVVRLEPLAGFNVREPELIFTVTVAVAEKESVIAIALFVTAPMGVTVQVTGVDDSAVPELHPVTVIADVL